VIGYELLTGHPPFDGRTLAEVVSMHLASEPAPLEGLCKASPELCDLVHRMLEKEPSLRPGAIEVRQMARALAMELSCAYESIEISGEEPRLPKAIKPARRAVALSAPVTDDAFVVDADALEFGVTEMVPTATSVIRKPRWTPEIGTLSPEAARPAITPKGVRDEVAGEIIAPKRRGA
jgi:serine/threonine protein kinase